MVLTLKAYRRCTLERNRRIPTIPAGRFDARLVNVSAVDTRPRRSESPWFVRQSPATPSRVLLHRSLAVVCAGSWWSWFDACPAQNWLEPASRPTPRGSGSTGQGLCVLHEGPTYPKCTRPSSSSTPPSCSASRRRRQPPERPGQPLRQVETAALPSLSRLADAPNRCLEMS